VRVAVQLRPGLAPVPRDTVAGVIDVLRATTTLTVALANGAASVAAELDPAAALARRDATPGALLCGERDGRTIAGFDLGNSPYEYGAEVVRGRPLVFASTNGSRAIRHAAAAREVLAVAFVNASAVVERLARAPHATLLCAGERGRFSLEDTACAGWIAARLVERGAEPDGAAARLAAAMAPATPEAIRSCVEGAAHARYLRTLGDAWARDIELCATLDAVGQVFRVG
jgi:2-phosphosulfolactate phosphatase